MAVPIYFPILRAKAGEIDAIGQPLPIGRDHTRPMFDFPNPAPKDNLSLAHYFGDKIQAIKTSWGTVNDVCLDFSRYEPDSSMADGQHIVDYVFNISRQARLKAVPVVAPLSLRGPGTHYFEAVSRVAARDKRGVTLRLPYEDFAVAARLDRSLRETLGLISVAPEDVDVYLDAESLALLPVESPDEIALARTLKTAAKTVLGFGCRRVVFTASSVPDSLTHHEKGKVLQVPRAEFRVWRRLTSDAELLSLGFGDYGVICPTQSESSGRVVPPSRVRVATEDELVLYKGAPTDIRTICRKAIEDGVVDNLADSWGVRAVRECAAGYGNPGNATDWVARDTNMHIENTVAAVLRHSPSGPVVHAPAMIGVRETWLQDSLLLPRM